MRYFAAVAFFIYMLTCTREAYKKWNLQDRAWVDMRLHESHDEGGFGVPNNTIPRHAAAYTTNARFVAFLGTFARPAQEVWLPGNDIPDPTTWSVPCATTNPDTLCQGAQLHTQIPFARVRKHTLRYSLRKRATTRCT